MSKSTKRPTTSKVKVKKTSPRISLTLSYIPIDHHVYYDGHAFRVRVRRNGKTTSFSTRDKKKAIKYRDSLLYR